MTISFVTPTIINLDAAFTFGMSVKGKESAIGFFGTGLKYAVATLLRTGHLVTIWVDGTSHLFDTMKKDHRGQGFEVVCLDGKPLGFTTELGKNWELWMAFRELHSNTLDEDGHTLPHEYDGHLNGVSIIEVTGLGIDKAYLERRETFCDGKVLCESSYLKIRHGSTNKLYYRGVRAYTNDKPGVFTYDLMEKQTLTEDRTFSSSWSALHSLKTAIASMESVECLRSILQAPAGSLERSLDFSSATPSLAFLQVVSECFRSEFLNPSARELGRLHNLGRDDQIMELDAIQTKQLDRAVSFLKSLDFDVTRYPIKVCELHGPLALAKDGVIFLSPQLFRKGTKYVALGIFEEFIHMSEGVHDETREMQTLLFEIIMSLGERVVGEPL